VAIWWKTLTIIVVAFLFPLAVYAPAIAKADTVQAPIVSFTQWHTTSSVIQPPTDRLSDIPPVVEIASPINQTVFQTSNVTITVDAASYFWIIDSVYYQADWQDGIHQIFGIQPDYMDALNATITVSFTQIPIGNHTVAFYANTHDNMHTNMAVTFTTEGYSPKILVLTTENQTYTSNEITLNFSIDKPTSWIGYSVDGQSNVTVSATNNGVVNNITIANLTSGIHNVVVYANDTMSDMSASQPINFNIASTLVSQSKPIPTIVLIALVSAITVIACMSVGVFLYRRHLKPTKLSS
jgi:hypothetical protein